MLLIHTYLGQSTIEGLGIFAGEPLSKGQIIWRLDPSFDRLISLSTLDSLPPHFRDYMGRYAFPLEGYDDVLVFEIDNGRYMNHSSTPNISFSENIRGIASRDVAVGEELTCDYSEFDPVFRKTGAFTNPEVLRQVPLNGAPNSNHGPNGVNLAMSRPSASVK